MTGARAGDAPVGEARTGGTALQLLRPVARAVPWRAVAAASGLGLLAAALPRLSGGEVTPWATVTALRAAALSFALGAAFLLDDPARHTTAAVPVRRALRQALRYALLVPFAALWWTAALLLVPEEARPPAGDVTLEAASALVLALAGAAFAARRGSARPGQGVAALLLLSAVLAPLLSPAGWGMFTEPADPRWAAAHDRWAVLLCALLLALAVSCAEPVRRRTLRALRSPSGTSGPSRG
ncbi:ABC transporter [Streptomyces sp. NPDC085937]|uniref:ABC transporter n=1 Tax=Streptomyces sp. NPDC085937 TaxID=3365742 RepID=UPI0037D146CF